MISSLPVAKSALPQNRTSAATSHPPPRRHRQARLFGLAAAALTKTRSLAGGPPAAVSSPCPAAEPQHTDVPWFLPRAALSRRLRPCPLQQTAALDQPPSSPPTLPALPSTQSCASSISPSLIPAASPRLYSLFFLSLPAFPPWTRRTHRGCLTAPLRDLLSRPPWSRRRLADRAPLSALASSPPRSACSSTLPLSLAALASSVPARSRRVQPAKPPPPRLDLGYRSQRVVFCLLPPPSGEGRERSASGNRSRGRFSRTDSLRVRVFSS